jgi:excisionase family DNA binding protein
MSDVLPTVAYKVPEVARALQIPRSTLYGHSQRGELSAERFGRHLRVTLEQLAAYLDVDPVTLADLMSGRSESTHFEAPFRTQHYAPTISVNAVPTRGPELTKAHLTIEQANAYVTWLMVDPDTRSYTVEEET